jgi:hypothetical protein
MTASAVTEGGAGHTEVVLGFERLANRADGRGVYLGVVVEQKEYVAGRTGQTYFLSTE